MSFGKNLQKCLENKGWTQSRLAKETGLNKSTLHAWTVGRENINLEYLKRVAGALEVSVHQLAFGESDPFEGKSNEILQEIFKGDVRVTLHRIARKK